MFNATKCCCGCSLEDGARKIGIFMMTAGFLTATIDMFKLAILIKDPELSYATPAPYLLGNITKQEVVETKKVGVTIVLGVECLEIVCGIVMLCGINLKNACSILVVGSYMIVDMLAVGCQFLMVIVDPHFFYILSTVERGSFYHCAHTTALGLQLLLLGYFFHVVISYLCTAYCRNNDT